MARLTGVVIRASGEVAAQISDPASPQQLPAPRDLAAQAPDAPALERGCRGNQSRFAVLVKNAGQVNPAAFVTGLVRVCDGFVTVFCLASC